MSVISSRESLLDAMDRGISPTIPAIEDFIEEVNDFLTLVNDYDEWEAVKNVWHHDPDSDTPILESEPAITVKKLRRMLGYSE